MVKEEYPEIIKLYDHVSNSGIMHLPGRKFPAVAIQGGSLTARRHKLNFDVL